jgi:hypothetical protein
MKSVIIALVGCAFAGAAFAEEPAGCDTFKWPLDKERAMLTSPNMVTVASGMSVALPLPVALTVTLVPFADAKLPTPPERAPRVADSFAGFIAVPAPAQDGSYKITLSSDAWIDVVQAGHLLKSGPHSGATGCQGVRKSVKFDLAAEPFVVQFSNVKTNSIGVAITAD